MLHPSISTVPDLHICHLTTFPDRPGVAAFSPSSFDFPQLFTKVSTKSSLTPALAIVAKAEIMTKVTNLQTIVLSLNGFFFKILKKF
jgi:hypothetical protein